MKSRLKQRIFALSLLAWTAVCPADAQQTRSLRDQFLSPSDERNVQYGERFENGHIQQTICQSGLWCDISIVSILRRVSAGNQEGFILGDSVFRFQFIRFRLIFKTFLQEYRQLFILPVKDSV